MAVLRDTTVQRVEKEEKTERKEKRISEINDVGLVVRFLLSVRTDDHTFIQFIHGGHLLFAL